MPSRAGRGRPGRHTRWWSWWPDSRASSPACVVDELALAVVVATDELELPGDVTLDKDAPKVVQFAAGGALDPGVHMEPVEIGLEFPSGRKDRVRVGMYGTVE